MLSHQDIILLTLLLSFDLSVQLVYVILLDLLTPLLGLLFCFVDVINVSSHLICIHGVVLSREILFSLLLLHLKTESMASVIFITVRLIALSLGD